MIGQSTLTALVIDDDKLVCGVVSKLLSRKQIKTVQVTAGNAAMKALEQYGQDLAIVVVDLILPHGLTGWDIVDFIRRNQTTSRTPIVVITGVVLSNSEMQKLQEKSCTVVRKQDFDINMFGEVIDRLLQTENA